MKPKEGGRLCRGDPLLWCGVSDGILHFCDVSAGFPVSPCLDKLSRDAKEAWRGDIVFTGESCSVPVGAETLAEKIWPRRVSGAIFFFLSLSLKWFFRKENAGLLWGWRGYCSYRVAMAADDVFVVGGRFLSCRLPFLYDGAGLSQEGGEAISFRPRWRRQWPASLRAPVLAWGWT